MRCEVKGLLIGMVVCLFAGCGQTGPDTPSESDTTSAASNVSYLLETEPEGAQHVIAARKDAKNNEVIVVVGRIGGSDKPWVAGMAAFSIVDSSLKACSDIEGDACPIPWDYCCATDQLPKATALVKVVDSDEKVVKKDARKFLNVKELATVVVQGKAQRDEAGNLTILATAIHVRK